MTFDDHKVPRRSLEEIEAETNRCRVRAPIDADGRIDMFGLLKAWQITLRVERGTVMGDDEAFSNAKTQEIFGRRSISQGLRFGDPHARYVVGHELGHMFLHRGDSPKPRKINGNASYSFIQEDESSEAQAWKFARALFITRDDLTSGETDQDIAIRVGVPSGAVALRRDEVREAMRARAPKAVPGEVAKFLATASSLSAKQAAWARAAQIETEDPSQVRLARGFRVEWRYYERWESHVGWTVINGEVRSFMDLQSR